MADAMHTGSTAFSVTFMFLVLSRLAANPTTAAVG
jgi:hypothetical protein